MKYSHQFLIIIIIIMAAWSCRPSDEKQQEPASPDGPMNVLFIAVDDLRPELNTYGADHIHSPNMDQLAAGGIQFNRAYCNVPVCGASRASLLTGTRPTRNRFLHYYTSAEEDYPEAITLPQHFRENGYYTVSNGKVFHNQDDSEDSWDKIWRPEPRNGSWRNYLLPENIERDTTGGRRGPPYEKANVPDSAYIDGRIANRTIQDLREASHRNEPFFIAAGFLKPHLPFNAPSKYWEMYDSTDIKIPGNDYPSKTAPDEAFHNFGELRNYGDIPEKGRVSEEMARTLIHGYYACVSYTDAMIGKVIDELERLGLRENTMIILWGDHGYNLREHGLWCKHCNFNTSLHVPLLMDVPGFPSGSQTDAVVEFVDIYPTLCDIAGLSKPDQLQGRSMEPLLEDPNAAWEDIAVAKWFDGATLIGDRYFYTEWSSSPDSIYADMLYDHQVDPEENINIAEDPENEDLVDRLSDKLHQNWGANYND